MDHQPEPTPDDSSKKGNGMLDDDFATGTRAATSSLEGNGLRLAKKNPPSVMSNQLREELVRILTTGDDQNEGAFTVAIATVVEKFAIAAREILMTENLAKNDLGALMMMRKPPFGGLYNGLGSAYGSETGLPLSSFPIVNNENFGVQAIKQVVDAIRTMGDSPAKLVEALAVARSNNLTDVVTVLEQKLGVSKAEAPPDGEVPGDAS